MPTFFRTEPEARPAANRTSETIARLIVVLADQQDVRLPAIASAQRQRDLVLVEGDLDEGFAADLLARGHRLAQGCDAPLETRIEHALRGQKRRRLTVTAPRDAARYAEVEAWAARFGVTVDILFFWVGETGDRAAA